MFGSELIESFLWRSNAIDRLADVSLGNSQELVVDRHVPEVPHMIQRLRKNGVEGIGSGELIARQNVEIRGKTPGMSNPALLNLYLLKPGDKLLGETLLPG